MKRIWNWGTFAFVMVGLWFFAGPTQVGGPASYVIVDGVSMEPTYQDGDLVVARSKSEYQIRDVIVYDAPINAQFDVIHRIVGTVDGGYTTQGDNMGQPDGWIAPHETIRGAALFHVPNGGHIVTFLRSPAVILGLLAGYVALEFLKRSERKRREDRSRTDDGEAERLLSTRNMP